MIKLDIKRLTSKKLLSRKVKVAFINPPHADWSLANNSAYLMFQSHYRRYGKYPDQIDWLKAPYKFNQYKTVKDIYSDGIEDADIYLFSSYVWNSEIIDELAEYVKQVLPNSLLVVGGPHIGANDKEFLKARNYYDYILRATKPGEVFVEDFLNEYIETSGNPDYRNLSWELRSEKTCPQLMQNYSVYEDHLDYLNETREYVRQENIEPFAIIETTRGCPYKCSFCEWGGGTGTKVYKKPIEIVKADILALKNAGYKDVYLTDANFGAFLERDLEIFKFAWENGIILTDVSTMKSKSLDRRIKLIDSWFNIVGSHVDNSKIRKDDDLPEYLTPPAVVPTVSIQSISDEAMKVANRVDLSFEDKVKLSDHIRKRCEEEGYPIPGIELILGMPGSTLQDFYEEMTLIWNFKAWSSHRHDYMILPDSELSDENYLKKYNIELVEVYTDLVDEDGVDNIEGLYKNKKHNFKTVSSCYSYTNEEMCEMRTMNLCAIWLLKNLYGSFLEKVSPPEFTKHCWQVIKTLDGFHIIWEEVKDIMNPNTPARNIKRLKGILRNTVVEEFLDKNRVIIYSELFKQIYLS
jgi:tRNA A37 methylthiotransferase MiaB